MWYVVHLLFAQEGSHTVVCETSQRIFQAVDANAAYERGELWAREYEQESNFLFVGIEHIKRIDEELGDGCEVGGCFSEEENVWQRRSELIPPKQDLSAIMWERDMDTPVADIMTDNQKRLMRQIFTDES